MSARRDDTGEPPRKKRRSYYATALLEGNKPDECAHCLRMQRGDGKYVYAVEMATLLLALRGGFETVFGLAMARLGAPGNLVPRRCTVNALAHCAALHDRPWAFDRIEKLQDQLTAQGVPRWIQSDTLRCALTHSRESIVRRVVALGPDGHQSLYSAALSRLLHQVPFVLEQHVELLDCVWQYLGGRGVEYSPSASTNPFAIACTAADPLLALQTVRMILCRHKTSVGSCSVQKAERSFAAKGYRVLKYAWSQLGLVATETTMRTAMEETFCYESVRFCLAHGVNFPLVSRKLRRRACRVYIHLMEWNLEFHNLKQTADDGTLQSLACLCECVSWSWSHTVTVTRDMLRSLAKCNHMPRCATFKECLMHRVRSGAYACRESAERMAFLLIVVGWWCRMAHVRESVAFRANHVECLDACAALSPRCVSRVYGAYGARPRARYWWMRLRLWWHATRIVHYWAERGGQHTYHPCSHTHKKDKDVWHSMCEEACAYHEQA